MRLRKTSPTSDNAGAGAGTGLNPHFSDNEPVLFALLDGTDSFHPSIHSSFIHPSIYQPDTGEAPTETGYMEFRDTSCLSRSTNEITAASGWKLGFL